MTTPTSRRRAAATATTLALLVPLAACSSDDSVAQPATTPVHIAPAAAAITSTDVAKACAAELGLNDAVRHDLPFPEGDEPTEKETAALKAFATDRLQPLVADLKGNAPTSLATAVTAIGADVDALAASGDLSRWMSTGSGPYADYTAVALGLLPSCGRVVEVHATEYAYSGIPASLSAGTVRFHLVNDGAENHELMLIRRPSDDTRTIEQIKALSPDEAQAAYEPGTVQFADTLPAGSGHAESVLSANVTPGEYLLLDTESIGDAGDGARGEGAPHYTKGMLAELTVTPAGDGGDAAAACAAATEFFHAFQTDFPFPAGETATVDELAAEKAFTSSRLVPLATTMAAGVPAASERDARAFQTDVADLARTGVLDPWFSLDANTPYAHANAVTLAVLGSCPGPLVEVSAIEYRYGGIPTMLPAGPVRFHLVNEGDEVFNFALLKLDDGDTTTLEQFRTMTEDQFAPYQKNLVGQIWVTPAGLSGTESAFATTLTPGRYLVLDTTPVGTVDDSEIDAAPHLSKGMLAEFTVTAPDAGSGK
jgi:hypothetical protein